MAGPLELDEVQACDAAGLNQYRAWVNKTQIVAIKDHNPGNGLGILEVLTTAGTFYMKDPTLPASLAPSPSDQEE